MFHRRFFLPLAAALTFSVAAAGSAAQAPAAAPVTAPPANTQQAAAATPVSASAATETPGKNPLPPGEHWLTDADGKRYYLAKWKKVEGTYVRTDKDHLRTAYGMSLKFEKEDKDYFYYRVDELKPVGHGPNPHANDPTPADLAAIAASYKVEIPQSHRLGFVDFGRGLPKSGQWRHGFDLADMNGDGFLDIVHGPPRKTPGSAPVIFLGDGKGNWTRWHDVSFPPFPYDYGDAKAADFKGDGHMGIALGIHLSGLDAVAGDGKGHFTNWNKGLDFALPSEAGAAAYSSRAIAIVDWNGDGKPDILASGEGPRLDRSGERLLSQPLGTGSDGPVIYLNQGDGTWKRKDQGTLSEQGFGDGVAVGDFNHDGRPDFVTASSVVGFTKIVHMHHAADDGWDNLEPGIRPNSMIGSVAVGDFDHDGRDDFVVGYASLEGRVWRHGVDVFLSRPDGKWERHPLLAAESKKNVTAMAVGDLDGDGNLDIVAATTEGEMWVFLGDGKGNFTRDMPGLKSPFPGCWGYHLQLADLDHDGKAEIVASFAGESGSITALGACPTGGGIAAWKTVPAGSEPAAPAAPGPAKTGGSGGVAPPGAN